MQSAISFVMSVITFISSFLGLTPAEPVMPASTEDFVPVVRFLACSDTHVIENYEESFRAGRIVKLFNVAYELAEQDEYYQKLDAAMFVGDCTNSGTDKEFEIFADEINRGKKEGTQILAVAADNHDGYAGAAALEKISSITGLGSDFHIVINGFHFIGISAAKKGVGRYTPAQRTWLKNELDKAKADDPGKPVFVCNHEHVLGTVYGSSIVDSWGTAYFKDILKNYPQVVHFSGHSHYPLNDPRSVVQCGFTAVGTGSMNYAEFTYGLKNKIHPAGNEKLAQAWIVEADKDNNVRLTGIDTNTAAILCRYVVPAVCEKSERVFTKNNMKLLSSAPAFDADAALEIEPNGDGTFTVTAPAAKSTDGMVVFAHTVKVFNKAGIKTYSEYAIYDYFISDSSEYVSFTVKAEEGYKIELTAENAYGMFSAPLSAVIG